VGNREGPPVRAAGATLRHVKSRVTPPSNAPAARGAPSSGGRSLRRTSVVRLVPDWDTEVKLRALCSLASKLWNEVNYARRRQFFEAKRVDLKGTYKEFYEKYKSLIGSATVQQILNKNDEAWRSFFGLLKAKKEGRLPPFVARINPPGYKKRGRSRMLWAILRNDQYKIEDNRIVLKGLGAFGRIEVEYRGLIHLRGRQGRLEIRYDPDRGRWYAHISFETEERAVRGEWRRVPQAPRGELRAGVDVGVNNLFAVYVENGEAFLASGRPLKAMSHYWVKRIAEYQSVINKRGVKTARRLRLMYRRWRRQAKAFIDAQVRRLVERLYEVGVSTVYVGYPKNIAQQKGNFNTVQVWSYGYLLKRLVEVSEEYGIIVIFVDEAHTSSLCPIHGEGCGKRVARGLFKCAKLGKAFNADLAAAYNILARGLSITPSPRKGIGVMGRRPGPGLNPDVAPNLSALAGTPAL